MSARDLVLLVLALSAIAAVTVIVAEALPRWADVGLAVCGLLYWRRAARR